MILPDYNFTYTYSSGLDHTPIELFSNALSRSTRLDLGLGFFSSASINVLAIGFAKFISNGGVLRMYINQYLSKEDYEMMSSHSVDRIEDSIITDFNEMVKVLSLRDEHFFNCLSYLIQVGRFEIKIIVPKTGGIAHQKFGVFYDKLGNKLAFNGSLNFTANALLTKNIETISCQMSWKGDQEAIASQEQLFKLYYDGNDDVIVYSAPKLEKLIVEKFPPADIKRLLEEEERIIKEIASEETSLAVNYGNDEPRFPYNSKPRDYQVEAYNAWVSRGKTGIFAMATGTGKTITSLNCALEEYNINKEYQLIILVPTNTLVSQWVDEVKKFNFGNIILVNGQSNWQERLVSLKGDFDWEESSNYVIISTYASFLNPAFIRNVNGITTNNTILIADEAHNIGAPKVKELFPELKVKKRIALSATPTRAYDLEGNMAIETFFNDSFPYCYSFSMERAIREGKLCPYCYYPVIVHLNEDEEEAYQRLTRLLLYHYDSKLGKLEESQEVTNILMRRKRIIHKAQDKYRVFSNILDLLINKGKCQYIFVYAPEGRDYEDEEESAIIDKLQRITVQRYPYLNINTIVGNDDFNMRAAKIQAFSEGKMNMLFAMKCLDEGVDIPRAEIGIFTSSTGNPRQFIQRRGRILRTHDDKQKAIVYDMIVVPTFRASKNDSAFEMERRLVRSELARVAHFASLALNYNEAEDALADVLSYYKFSLSLLIDELNK